MIIRLMGEGQYTVPDKFQDELNRIDTAAGEAVTAGDEAALRGRLEELARTVREHGERLDDTHLSGSDAIVPPPDLSIEEARELFTGDGLIPDLPV